MQRAPREISTNRLVLRPPDRADAALWRGLSGAPGAVPVAWGTLEDCVGRWERTGFDFGIVQENSTRAGVGIGGIRHSDGDSLTLAYSLREDVRGRGLGTEAGRAWTAHALEWLPALPLIAPLSVEDPTSVRIAVGSGLEPISADTWSGPLPAVAGATCYVAPKADTPTWLDPTTRSSVLDLWCAVNDAGGAVGFLPGAPRHEVLATLTRHEDAMAAGTTTAVLLRAPDATVVAMGFLVAGHNPLLSHTRTAYRVMTDPSRRGRNLGRLLMAAMHRVAREQGVEVVVLDVRSGLGTTGFYEGCGYVEVGRVPGIIRVASGDDRDSVIMARRLDGKPMVADGRA